MLGLVLPECSMVLGVVLGDFVWVEWRDGGEVGVARWVTCRIWECRNEMGYLPYITKS